MKKTLIVIIGIILLLSIVRTQSDDYKYMKDLKESNYIEYKPNNVVRNPMTGELVSTIEER